uniref:Uncharacterized protein n=1 Tax=Megaselia scalaris TaxID=36166 RepID=T1GCS8_MEGSC
MVSANINTGNNLFKSNPVLAYADDCNICRSSENVVESFLHLKHAEHIPNAIGTTTTTAKPEKMLLRISLITLLIVSVTFNDATAAFSEQSSKEVDSGNSPHSRVKRGFFYDFFQKMITTKNLIVDQYNDTKTTFNEVYNIISDGFSDTTPKSTGKSKPKIDAVPANNNSNSTDDASGDNSVDSTTTERYRISRYELGRILGRNYRGLKKLYQLELNDALNQSHYNIEEYKRQHRNSFANSVVVQKKEKFFPKTKRNISKQELKQQQFLQSPNNN